MASSNCRLIFSFPWLQPLRPSHSHPPSTPVTGAPFAELLVWPPQAPPALLLIFLSGSPHHQTIQIRQMLTACFQAGTGTTEREGLSLD